MIRNNKSLIHKNRESLKRRIWPCGNKAATHTTCSQKQSITPKIVLPWLFPDGGTFVVVIVVANTFILNLTL